MNKLNTFAAVSFALVALTTQALALNPQPEPPGKNRVGHGIVSLHTIGSATGGAGAGRFSDADDNYCGTKVPGLPHGVGGFNGGGRFSDADDNYCGTEVPGHFGGPIHYNAMTFRNSHGAVMLNPQPLPPRDGGSRFRY